MTADVAPIARIPRFQFVSDAQALTALDRQHKFVLNIGGKGSGKTWTHIVWALERGFARDTHRLHGIFTNTQRQLDDAVLQELKRFLPMAGVQTDFDRRPPRSWIRKCVREGI